MQNAEVSQLRPQGVWEWINNVYIQALLILLLSIALAKLVDILFTKAILKLAARTKTELDDRIIRALHRPIFYSIILAGLHFAVAHLDIPRYADFYFVGLVKTVAVIVWAWAILRITSALIEGLGRRVSRDELVQGRFVPLLANLAKIIIFLAGFIILLSIWGIRVTALLASAGIAGLVIGLAARDTLANFFGGLFILVDSPYKVGDYIVLDSGEKGIVTDIGIRSTRIRTRDDIEITIPNAQIANSKITNESGPQDKTRVRARVGVAYGSDVDKVKQVLLELARANGDVCESPEPRARFREFGDSSLNFELLCWIENPLLRGQVLDELNTQIYKRFAQKGIEIPFPQRDLYIKRMPSEDRRESR